MSKKEWYSNRQFVESLLPSHYKVKENLSGNIACRSIKGIDDERDWNKFMADIKNYF